MYKLCNNIRIKTCDEISFFINIDNNSIFNIKTDTLNYLLRELNMGLLETDLKQHNSFFVDFIVKLKDLNILMVDTDEN